MINFRMIKKYLLNYFYNESSEIYFSILLCVFIKLINSILIFLIYFDLFTNYRLWNCFLVYISLFEWKKDNFSFCNY